ncbi:MAG TPA: hypothetical protein DD827_03375 [Gammaproteobacteria bacterium]|jgi:tetratricopeptide (TPR) repeat protein|nr:hypothetical protein [Gammaproteobacteria bacterium]
MQTITLSEINSRLLQELEMFNSVSGLFVRITFFSILLFPMAHADPGCQVAPERQVIDQFMALNPGGALQQISQISSSDSENPALDLYRGMAAMVRAFRDDAVDAARRPYDDEALRYFAQAVKKANRRIESNPADAAARFALGASQSYQAGLLEARGKRLKALKLVHRGREELQSLITDHPDMEEAYMVLGLFEYFLGNNAEENGMSARLLNLTGDPELGLSYLERAVESAPNVAPEAARILLMDTSLSDNEMCRYADLSTQMNTRYPSNRIFRLLSELLPLQCRLAEAEGESVSPSVGVTLNTGCTG